MLIKKKLKAFTIIELLISMTLSAILIVFAFLGYNQVQKLFLNYTTQSNFISNYNQLNKALFILSNKAKTIEKINETRIVFKNDSNVSELILNKENILVKLNSHTDTFPFSYHTIHYDLIRYNNTTLSNVIINFNCEVLFQTQRFNVSFHKDYDACSILNSTIALFPIDEQY